MRRIFYLVIIMLINSSLYAATFTLGEVQLAPCTKTDYKKITMPFGAPLKIPVPRHAKQSSTIFAVIEGRGVEDKVNENVMQTCVSTASKIGLNLIASDIAGVSPLFKLRLVKCLKNNSPNITITSLYLKSKSVCAW